MKKNDYARDRRTQVLIDKIESMESEIRSLTEENRKLIALVDKYEEIIAEVKSAEDTYKSAIEGARRIEEQYAEACLTLQNMRESYGNEMRSLISGLRK